ncbi:alpha/beta fold hydrolase [Methylomonas sp. 11b]|uniref:alpha/beta fold hydrolase n=1 Tax=Methylomonas sp. 11b TaxID=1168169 RepID=UPI00047E6F9F|nr:alpha/beta hydrolase [Methylomonas sp. 11b]
MKRILQMSGVFLLVFFFSVWIWLSPMSGNFLNYLIWKATTSTQTVSGDIENQGAQIRYVAYGQGEPILLLHGGLSNKLSWFSQIPWLVESGRRVILIDTRGHGESTPGHSALTYQVFAEDTLLVLDRLGIQRTNIVGWSDGGIIALILGLESPQRVGKIIAISANFHPSGVIQASDNSQVDAISPPQHKLLDWLRGWWSGAGENHPALEAEIKALWRVAPQLKHTDLQEITAPTLVIAGENDIIDLPHSGELAQMLARAKIEIVLGAGHAAPVTHARQVNQLIASFLDLNQ